MAAGLYVPQGVEMAYERTGPVTGGKLCEFGWMALRTRCQTIILHTCTFICHTSQSLGGGGGRCSLPTFLCQCPMYVYNYMKSGHVRVDFQKLYLGSRGHVWTADIDHYSVLSGAKFKYEFALRVVRCSLVVLSRGERCHFYQPKLITDVLLEL